MVNKLPYILNYYWHSQKGTNSFGGVAILLHSSLKSKIIDKTEHFLAIELELGQEEILLESVYVPPDEEIPTKTFEIFRDKIFFLFGDFNAKHIIWGCKINNSNGIKMKEWLEQNDYEGIFPTTPTSKRSD
ncbi:hypothetical protein I4U23_011168 [Adineta vaga]|nr:hypothetical protein I4U23_011168 [Adineta vaga]